MKGNFVKGAAFFGQGISLIFSPGLRRYIFVPVFINVLLFSAIFAGLAWYFHQHFSAWIGSYPHWIVIILGWLFWILYGILSLFVGTFTFTMATNIIGSPFYGLLAEKVEKSLNQTAVDIPFSIFRILKRELIKLLYFIPWFIFGAFAFLFAFLWPILPFILFLPLAWIIAIQYVDYCPDNQGIAFKPVLKKLKENALTLLGFGSVVSLAMTIPGANLFVPPAAVAGGCALWLSLSQHHSFEKNPAQKKIDRHSY